METPIKMGDICPQIFYSTTDDDKSNRLIIAIGLQNCQTEDTTQDGSAVCWTM